MYLNLAFSRENQGSRRFRVNQLRLAKKKHESAPPPEPPVDQSTIASFGLTVRVEVNLPADADQETYDKIFQSIRKNLINGK